MSFTSLLLHYTGCPTIILPLHPSYFPSWPTFSDHPFCQTWARTKELYFYTTLLLPSNPSPGLLYQPHSPLNQGGSGQDLLVCMKMTLKTFRLKSLPLLLVCMKEELSISRIPPFSTFVLLATIQERRRWWRVKSLLDYPTVNQLIK